MNSPDVIILALLVWLSCFMWPVIVWCGTLFGLWLIFCWICNAVKGTRK